MTGQTTSDTFSEETSSSESTLFETGQKTYTFSSKTKPTLTTGGCGNIVPTLYYFYSTLPKKFFSMVLAELDNFRVREESGLSVPSNLVLLVYSH